MARWFELPNAPIRITARGQWMHGDNPLHPKVEALFRRSVEPDEQGRYFVVLGFRRHELQVEDAAYFVRSVQIEKDAQGQVARVLILVSDGATEELDPATLMQSDDDVLYCRIRRNDMLVPCRFLPQQYHDLALYAEESGRAFQLNIGHKYFEFGRYSRNPVRLS